MLLKFEVLTLGPKQRMEKTQSAFTEDLRQIFEFLVRTFLVLALESLVNIIIGRVHGRSNLDLSQ